MRNATANATAGAAANATANATAGAAANATAPVVDPEDLPPAKRDYRISAGNTTNATNPV
jgi:hypothetical protein